MALTLSTIFHFHRNPARISHLYQAPLYPFLPVTLITGALAIVIYSLLQRPIESLFSAVTVLSGIPFYFLWRRSNSSAS
jgi:APA family basic amino acid/polyamine antiporter